MTDHRQTREKSDKTGGSPGNLGQKQAEREEAADEKFEHMGDKQPARGDASKDQKKQSK